jgi:hypothetical protein
MGFVWFSLQTAIISLNSVNQLIFVMVKCGVYFAVRTEFLNIIWTSFGFKGLRTMRFLVIHSVFQIYFLRQVSPDHIQRTASWIPIVILSVSFRPFRSRSVAACQPQEGKVVDCSGWSGCKAVKHWPLSGCLYLVFKSLIRIPQLCYSFFLPYWTWGEITGSLWLAMGQMNGVQFPTRAEMFYFANTFRSTLEPRLLSSRYP